LQHALLPLPLVLHWVLVMLFLGFSAGLPFLLVFSTLSAWLADVDVDRASIGYFSWVGIMFSIKVFWAPVVDRLKLPLLTRWLGQRRSWLVVAQIGIAVSLLLMGTTQPVGNLALFAQLALLVAFFSATQDICIDAYRIDSAADEFQGAMAATYIFGYRVAMLMAGAGSFYIADMDSWGTAYLVMAVLMGVGLITTFIVDEPDTPPRDDFGKSPAQWINNALVRPFADFFGRYGQYALMLLALVAVYRISDITMGVMANPFYLDLGFSKTEIAEVTKIFGFFMTIFGASLGGVLVLRFGMMRPLLLGAILVSVTNLLFAFLAMTPPDLTLLAMVISADNLSGGIATAVFIAYLSSLTNTAYTATQYALFSSLMTLPAKLLGGFSGEIVEEFGYPAFFIYASVIGIPAILLVIILY